MKISEVMRPDDVLVDVSAVSKTNLLQLLSNRAAEFLGVNRSDIVGALEHRENLGSTGFGAGIAIPHAPVAGVTAPFALLIRLARPIEFEAIDDRPVDVICLILTPPGDQAEYLKLLSMISRKLRSPETLKTIRSATDAGQIYATIAMCDD
ncbi:PTS sugar transporter subunit IIA [Martelella soudanensis]|uniref:PTS sugar transporter subunit IIA n=1 Tax=unclassified Martelella TaxID=2629616 RepID=UPI0015DE68C2|nr:MULTISPECIES: PTS sugar transporter subunit IIA [unclassified Martelella]